MIDIDTSHADSIARFDVVQERRRQLEKWGVQSHQDGTSASFAPHADAQKRENDRAADEGLSAWSGILIEEVYEALAETDPERIREELVQVAAVAVGWIEDIDQRQFTRIVEAPQLRSLDNVAVPA